MNVGDILTRARDILQDRDKIRWADYELVWWLNDAYSDIAVKRPDAFIKPIRIVVKNTTSIIRCEDTIALAEAVRIVDVLLTFRAGFAQHQDAHSCRLIDKSILDDQLPYWRNMPGTHPKFWTFESGSPTAIELFPRVNHASGQYIELLVALAPGTHAGNAITAPLLNAPLSTTSDIWAPIILDYVLYRAYQKDAEYTANAERSALFYNRFQEALKLKTPGETAVFNSGVRPTRKARMINPNQPT